MIKEIKQFKKENGSINYTVKELVGALHTKVDRVEIKIQEVVKQEAINKTRINSIATILKVGVPLLVITLGYIIFGG